jgi:hypothetical protein
MVYITLKLTHNDSDYFAPMGQLESMQRDVTPMDAAISISEGLC